jgi:hypothetical protein
MDFRYATFLLSEINHEWHFDNTSEMVTNACAIIKELSSYVSFGSLNFSFHGILIPAMNGNHVVLFDIKCLKECPNEFLLPTLHKDVTWAVEPDISPIRIDSHDIYPPPIYVPDASSNNPIQVWIDECCIEDAVMDPIDISDWPVKLERFGFRQPNYHLSEETVELYSTIAWDTFLPVYGSHIDIPTNTVFWRGYDKSYPSITDRSAYYGDKDAAKEYVKTSSEHMLGLFATSRPLKLLDVRFLKVLLKDLFEGMDGNAVQKTTVAFGLCSFRHQLRLMSNIYADAIREGRDPGYEAMERVLMNHPTIEQPGVRVAETTNDGWVMTFLGEVFEGIIDGFVSPPLFTPYQHHTRNWLHSELVVFNPLKSGIVQLSAVPRMVQISIADLIREQFPTPITLRARGLETSYVSCGGGGILIPPLEAFNNLLNCGDIEAIRLYRDAKKEGKRFRKRIAFIGRTFD